MLPFLKWRLPGETRASEGWLLCCNMLEVALELAGKRRGSLRPRARQHYTPPSPIDNARNTSPRSHATFTFACYSFRGCISSQPRVTSGPRSFPSRQTPAIVNFLLSFPLALASDGYGRQCLNYVQSHRTSQSQCCILRFFLCFFFLFFLLPCQLLIHFSDFIYAVLNSGYSDKYLPSNIT